jgi:hypothetical protein
VPARPSSVVPQPAIKRPTAKQESATLGVEKPSGLGRASAAAKAGTAPDHTVAATLHTQSGAPKPKTLSAKAANLGRIKKVVVVGKLMSPAATGFEVPGCTYYSLEEGRVAQRCSPTGRPGNRDFWTNYERLLGHGSDSGSGGGGSE